MNPLCDLCCQRGKTEKALPLSTTAKPWFIESSFFVVSSRVISQMRNFIFCVVLCLTSATEPPIVSTKLGDIQGFRVPQKGGGQAEVFLAIPYAKPPVGNLRFEKPEPLEPWNDIYSATTFRNSCTPHMRIVAQFMQPSGEDCLTLNVVRPQHREELLPVLFWIHGGGYEIGSAAQHGYQVFADNYVGNGVIVVTIQYRLGFMGFLTDGTKNAPGNMGLFDQAAALKFVQDHIEDFGGDKRKVTVWGYSAGGASASQLTLSPYSRELFSNAILMSASSFVSWATGLKVVENCQLLAKRKTVDEIFDAVDKIGGTTQTADFLRFAPVIDGDFLPKHPYDLVEDAPIKPTIIGLSSKESAFFTVMNNGAVLQSFGLSAEEMAKVDKDYVVDVIRKKLLYEKRFGKNFETVLEEISNFYLKPNEHPEDGDNAFYVDKYTEMLSDLFFNVASVREINRKLEVGTPIWAYKFEHFNDGIFAPHIPDLAKGSPHGNEYQYLFEMQLFSAINMTIADENVKKDITEMVITFAKNRKPKVRDIKWDQVSDPHNIHYLRFTSDPEVENGFFQEADDFWRDLAKLGFDLIDPMSSHSSFLRKEEL
ncbi:unnamed protein product [Caenorhabditis auriculariae]|uniref:Carboxylic ester hydrolase n=1 Tax=Caenorhabditis auriculariae TaxID=2777116 RepID=A0A8S1HGB4_9PELO|nr:unnamed protein product [Caenorhabditis auriculariae]